MAKKKKKTVQRPRSNQASNNASTKPRKTGSATTAPKGRPTQRGRPQPTRRRMTPARKTTMSWWILGIGITVIVLAIVILPSLLGHEDGETDKTAFDLPALDGDGPIDSDGRVLLTDFAGKPLVLNFFASWCTACEAELPLFRDTAVEFDDSLEIVFVNSNETGNWKPMAQRTGIIDQPLAKDINGSNGNGLYRSLGGTGGMPMTAFFDAAGNVVHVDRGELSPAILRSRLQQLFGLGA